MVVLAYDAQGVILCHFFCHMVKLLMHSTMLHICKITYVEQLGMKMLLHIRRFVSGICYDAGDGKYWSIHHSYRTFRLMIMV